MAVRSRFRDDGAQRYEEVRSGLNRMTLAKVETIIRNSGLRTEYTYYFATKGLPVVDRLPYVREFFVSCCDLHILVK